jgi:hypothetical protein
MDIDIDMDLDRDVDTEIYIDLNMNIDRDMGMDTDTAIGMSNDIDIRLLQNWIGLISELILMLIYCFIRYWNKMLVCQNSLRYQIKTPNVGCWILPT